MTAAACDIPGMGLAKLDQRNRISAASSGSGGGSSGEGHVARGLVRNSPLHVASLLTPEEAKRLPPMLLVHGVFDTTVPPGQMAAMRSLLMTRGAEVVDAVWLTTLDHAAFKPLMLPHYHEDDPGVHALWRRLGEMANATGLTAARSRL